MYTVLIFGEQTGNSFMKHLPLFDQFVEDGRIGTCLWNEAGKTLEEALPELHSLTDDKPVWRAIIVTQEEEPAVSRLQRAADNPFDFTDRKGPIVQLTRWLSMPMDTFSMNLDDDSSEEVFDGILPESVLCISARDITSLLHVSEGISALNEPDFVMRNGYPHDCRFVVIDRMMQGPWRKLADDFLFWSSVLLLAVNDSPLFGTQQLWRLSLELDQEELNRIWGERIGRLRQARKALDRILSSPSVYLAHGKGAYPSIHVQLEKTQISLPDAADQLNPAVFGRTPESPEEQKNQLLQETQRITQQLNQDWTSIKPALQKTMTALQKRPGYLESEVEFLDPDQVANLKNEVQTLRLSCIQMTGQLEQDVMPDQSELIRMADEAAEAVEMRLSRAQILKTGLLMTAVSLSGSLPAWTAVFQGNVSGILWLPAAMLVLAAIPVLSVRHIRKREKQRIMAAVRLWNSVLEKHTDMLMRYVDQYMEYGSAVLSCRRGESYLDWLEIKQKDEEDIHRKLNSQRKDVLQFLQMMENLAKALKLVNLDIPVLEDDLQVQDFLSREFDLELFSLQDPDFSRPCQIQETGRNIQSPYPYIQSVSIKPLGRRKPQ